MGAVRQVDELAPYSAASVLACPLVQSVSAKSSMPFQSSAGCPQKRPVTVSRSQHSSSVTLSSQTTALTDGVLSRHLTCSCIHRLQGGGLLRGILRLSSSNGPRLLRCWSAICPLVAEHLEALAGLLTSCIDVRLFCIMRDGTTARRWSLVFRLVEEAHFAASTEADGSVYCNSKWSAVREGGCQHSPATQGSAVRSNERAIGVVNAT